MREGFITVPLLIRTWKGKTETFQSNTHQLKRTSLLDFVVFGHVRLRVFARRGPIPKLIPTIRKTFQRLQFVTWYGQSRC